jgi:hypothetical protein
MSAWKNKEGEKKVLTVGLNGTSSRQFARAAAGTCLPAKRGKNLNKNWSK